MFFEKVNNAQGGGDPTKEEQLRKLYRNDPRAFAPIFSKEYYEWNKDIHKVEGTYGLWNKILYSEPARYNCIFWDKTFDIIQSIGSFPTSPYDVVRDQTMNNPDFTIEEKAEILFWIDWHEEYMNTYKPK